MSIDNRPDDIQWGSNYPLVDPTGEKQTWKRQTGKIQITRDQSGQNETGANEPGRNEPGRNETGKKQPTFIRHPARFTLALLVETWTRLENRWEANPGFFAATAAGSVGLVLIAAMLFNAGVGWLQDDPVDDEVVVDAPDSSNTDSNNTDAADSDLGDPSGDEIFVMKGKSRQALQDDDDDPGIDSDPFADTGMRDKPIARIIVTDPVEDEPDDATEPATPVQIAKAVPQEKDPFDQDNSDDDDEKSRPEPKQDAATASTEMTKSSNDADEDSEPDEPVAQRPLPEMRVASQPQLPAIELDDEEEGAAKTDPPVEADEPPAEPAKLKPQTQIDVAADDEASPAIPIMPAKPIKSDDIPSKPERSIDLVRGPPEKAVPEQDPRWRQQRSKSATETPAPAVVARHSSPVETRIFAAAPPNPNQQGKPSQPASSNPVAKQRPAPQEKSSATPIRLTMSGPPVVGLGQPCQIEIHVTNTGSETVRRLVVSAELPDGLVHEVSQSLEQKIETLAPGATYRARLRLRGQALGAKTIQVEVGPVEAGQADSSTDEMATVQMSAKVRVVPVSEAVTVVGSDDCLCAPLVR